MPTSKETPDGVRFAIRAQPGSRRNEVRIDVNGTLKVAVTQVAEKGKANKAILAVLAKSLGLRKSRLTLVSGESSREKVVQVKGINASEFDDLLRDHLVVDP